MTRAPRLVADLTTCDREPIHQLGAVLAYGAMLVIDPESFEIVQAAGNCAGLLGAAPEAMLGRSIDSLFDAKAGTMLRSLSSTFALDRPRHLLHPALAIADRGPIDASLHRSDDLLLLEIEAADLTHPHVSDPIACVQEMLDGLEGCHSLEDCCQRAVEQVRRVIGYDRVMLYRFQPDDSGWVFAEDKRDDLPAFRDLHYPASDIPVQARALYVRSPLRMIDLVDAAPAPLVPRDNPATGEPLDLSMAVLRDVSPIHREYLRNMGVVASMSISIVRGGKLWGLIACHHYSARILPRHLRAVCELFGSMVSLQLEARDRAALLEARLGSRRILQQMMRNLAHADDYAAGLIGQSPNLLDYISSDGVALRIAEHGGVVLCINNEVATRGYTPDEGQIAALTEWLAREMDPEDGIFATDCLADHWPGARDFAEVGAGILALSVSREPHDFIIWFRPEQVRNVRWAGDPTKAVIAGPNGDRLTPRGSFDEWVETVRGRAAPWAESDTDAAFDLRVSLLEVVLRRIDNDARERERAYRQEQMLMAELDHRVKNTLANIQALVRSTSSSADTVSEFVEGLEGRIRAMSRAHSLLTKSRWDGASIRSLLSEELAPFEGRSNTLSLAGPDAMVTPKAALALSLAVHELTTNSAKYGALSVDRGSVEVAWRETAGGGMSLKWVERSGPAVIEPLRRGFGSTLIERALRIETGGQSTMTFAQAGLECEIDLPAACMISVAPVPDNDRVRTPAAADAAASDPGKVRVLVVEDAALVLMAIEDLVEMMGWTLVGPATRIDEALTMAREDEFDVALLDVNLNGERSWSVGEALKSRGIPFLFGTGYDISDLVPEGLAGSPVLTKPYRLDDLEQALRSLVDARAEAAPRATSAQAEG